ncbi:MAG: ferredoxin reductase family protein [Coriobacteriia bacterium]|nr:ferredoxin reductase family protein [Coriobacteriia bacterium]
MRLMIRGVFWFGLYTFLITFPLVVGAVFINPAQSPFFLVNLSAGFAYIGLAIMAAELALVARFDGAASAFGEDSLLQFHRQIGITALVLVALHPLLLIATGGYTTRILLPWGGNPWPVWMGSAAFLAALLIVGLSVLRKRLGTSYEVWQGIHGTLSMALFATAGIHIAAVGRFSALPVMRAAWALYVVAFLGMFLRYRLARPLQMRKRPWEVVENREEIGDARTIVLRPVGHDGFTFEPGQFGWVGFGRSPFALTQHPICFSSNGDIPSPVGEITFTIKNLGDWSGTVVPALEPGDRAWVDGPHGVFTMDREEGAGYGLIGGGVGITPVYSMLLAMERRGDVRPVVLFYGANTENDLIFDAELQALDDRMGNLQIVRVLARPSDAWAGERGFITAELLKRHLPDPLRRHFQYFVCGPNPLMDAMETALPSIGIPADRVHTERFDMV